MKIFIKQLFLLSLFSISLPIIEAISQPKHPCFGEEKYKSVALEIHKKIDSIKDPLTKNGIYTAVNVWKKLISPIQKCYGFDRKSKKYIEGKNEIATIKELPQQAVFDTYFGQSIEHLFNETFKLNNIALNEVDKAYELCECQSITDADIALRIELSKVLEHFEI